MGKVNAVAEINFEHRGTGSSAKQQKSTLLGEEQEQVWQTADEASMQSTHIFMIQETFKFVLSLERSFRDCCACSAPAQQSLQAHSYKVSGCCAPARGHAKFGQCLLYVATCRFHPQCKVSSNDNFASRGIDPLIITQTKARPFIFMLPKHSRPPFGFPVL